MTFSVNATGYKDTASEDESRELEEAVAAKAQAFIDDVKALGCTVSVASFTGGHIGTRDLTATRAPEPAEKATGGDSGDRAPGG